MPKEMKFPVFIIGSGRSGTTWLHLMLGSHKLIATGQESQIFHNYFRQLRSKWEDELAYPQTEELRFHGISAYIDEPRFYQLMRQFADGVFSKLFEVKPEAEILLEKSPNNSFNVDTIFKCYPEARFIHVIRDGRDVVSSMLAAKKSWGRQWAPTFVQPAAEEWKAAVLQSKSIQFSSPHYIEVRYEDLLTNGYAELRRLFTFLGISCGDDEIKEIYDSHTFSKLSEGNYNKNTFINPGQTKASGTDQRSEPREFFRKGVSGGWKDTLSSSEIDEFMYYSGDLLIELGYLPKTKQNFKKPIRVGLRQLKKDILEVLRNLARRVLGH